VTKLESRTPHQPEKLKKLSKNEYGFTPSRNNVNRKSSLLTIPVFSRVQPVHKPMTGFGAAARSALYQTLTSQAFSHDSTVFIEMKPK
jgi:hypothetical protein